MRVLCYALGLWLIPAIFIWIARPGQWLGSTISVGAAIWAGIVCAQDVRAIRTTRFGLGVRSRLGGSGLPDIAVCICVIDGRILKFGRRLVFQRSVCCLDFRVRARGAVFPNVICGGGQPKPLVCP